VAGLSTTELNSLSTSQFAAFTTTQVQGISNSTLYSFLITA
jgi:hypothetical protein